MSKGLPWAGAYKHPGKATDQFAPKPGSYADPQSPVPAPSSSSDAHPSLAKDFAPREIMRKGRQ